MKLCPKLKIKRKPSSKKTPCMPIPNLPEIMDSFGIGKLKRVTQTEKKVKPTENEQLKKYQPLTNKFKNYSASKSKLVFSIFLQILLEII